MSGASERANGRGSGPVLTSRFLVDLDHSATSEKINKMMITFALAVTWIFAFAHVLMVLLLLLNVERCEPYRTNARFLANLLRVKCANLLQPVSTAPLLVSTEALLGVARRC